MRTRRWAATVVCVALVSILLGAVINVAVAWGCAWWVKPTGAGYRFSVGRSDAKLWTLARFEAFGTTLLFSDRGPDHEGFLTTGPPPSNVAPAWSTLRTPVSDAAGRLIVDEYRIVDGRGWPLRSLMLHCTVLHREDREVPMIIKRWMIDLDPLMTSPIVWSGWGTFRWLPLRPIWIGFTINTAIYALIVWLLLHAPRTLRRWRRVRSGLCPACGYDLRGRFEHGCPECGYERSGVNRES